MAASLPYHEPDIKTILIISSLLILSNILKWALDRLIYCGLLGQILLGIAWGTAGGKWLDGSIETAIVQFGYLGLLLLVYEGICSDCLETDAYNLYTGGLSISYQSLKANLSLSIAVALTGIAFPIGISFVLGGLAMATPLQSFAAGASLCSTSLGTTFTVLSTTGLLKTRLGIVLTSSAMLDDVIGLVMVQVISSLGSITSEFSAITIIRPVFVSLAFAIVSPLFCWLVLKPITLKLNSFRDQNEDGWLHRLLSRKEASFGLHTTLLIVMVTSSSYAGTSNLFAAYLAGAIISWWDTELPHSCSQAPHEDGIIASDTVKIEPQYINSDIQSGMAIYERYYAPANERILKPFFFVH